MVPSRGWRSVTVTCPRQLLASCKSSCLQYGRWEVHANEASALIMVIMAVRALEGIGGLCGQLGQASTVKAEDVCVCDNVFLVYDCWWRSCSLDDLDFGLCSSVLLTAFILRKKWKVTLNNWPKWETTLNRETASSIGKLTLEQ